MRKRDREREQDREREREVEKERGREGEREEEILRAHMTDHTVYGRGGGLGSRPIFKKFHETYAPS